jgi:hypothetical protein
MDLTDKLKSAATGYLMHGIVTDRLSVDEARKQYGEIMAALMMNRPASYAQSLQFQVPHGETGDRDESVIGGSDAASGKRKGKRHVGEEPIAILDFAFVDRLFSQR